MSEQHDTFPQERIRDELKGTTRSMIFGEEEVDNLLSYKYGGRYMFLVLSLLYPSLDYRNQFHQDHIFPRSFLTTLKKLNTKGIPADKQQFYLENFDCLAKLHLLEGVPNQEKLDRDFRE
jgi:hypothetical protein